MNRAAFLAIGLHCLPQFFTRQTQARPDSTNAQGGSDQAVEAWRRNLSEASRAWRYSRGGSTSGCCGQALVALQPIQVVSPADSGQLRQRWQTQTHMTSTSRTAPARIRVSGSVAGAQLNGCPPCRSERTPCP